MQVGREAGNLELADNARVAAIAEVEREQRIDWLERDEVRLVAQEARRHDALALRDAADVADDVELRAVILEHPDVVLHRRSLFVDPPTSATTGRRRRDADLRR